MNYQTAVQCNAQREVLHCILNGSSRVMCEVERKTWSLLAVGLLLAGTKFLFYVCPLSVG